MSKNPLGWLMCVFLNPQQSRLAKLKQSYENHIAWARDMRKDVEARLGDMGRRIDVLETRLEYLSKRYDELDKTFSAALDLNLDTIKNLANRLDEIEERLDTLIRDTNERFRSNNKHFQMLGERIEKLKGMHHE